MTFDRNTWANAAKRRGGMALLTGAGATICGLAAAGGGYASLHFADEALKEWDYARGIESIAYTNGGISLAALLATCAFAVGAIRLYKSFGTHFSTYRQARSATRAFDRRI